MAVATNKRAAHDRSTSLTFVSPATPLADTEELPELGSLRVSEDILRAAFFVDPALMHEDDAAADVAGKLHLMRDHQERHSLGGKLAHHRQNFGDQFRIERRGNLVAEKCGRPHGERAGNGDALLLAARELIRIGVELVAQPHPLQHLAGDGFCLGLRSFLDHGLRQHDIAAGAQVREKVELLKDHADLETQRLQMHLVSEELRTGHGDGAAGDGLQTVDAAKQGRFARTALADNGDDFPRLYIEIDAFQHLGGAKAFADFSDFDERH
ncbi:6-pyruvoyl-tetrahydropterin synthase [Rhizobium etli CNPAF512]|nr:6-pyruvoyl-tetrahydropterin synthase [Rhizobium etli CNPAF512]